MTQSPKTVHMAKFVVFRYRFIAVLFFLLIGVLVLRELEHSQLRLEAQKVMAAGEVQFKNLNEAARCLAQVQEEIYLHNVHLMNIQGSRDKEDRLQAIAKYQASQARLDAAALELKRVLASWERGSK